MSASGDGLVEETEKVSEEVSEGMTNPPADPPAAEGVPNAQEEVGKFLEPGGKAEVTPKKSGPAKQLGDFLSPSESLATSASSRTVSCFLTSTCSELKGKLL